MALRNIVFGILFCISGATTSSEAEARQCGLAVRHYSPYYSSNPYRPSRNTPRYGRVPRVKPLVRPALPPKRMQDTLSRLGENSRTSRSTSSYRGDVATEQVIAELSAVIIADLHNFSRMTDREVRDYVWDRTNELADKAQWDHIVTEVTRTASEISRTTLQEKEVRQRLAKMGLKPKIQPSRRPAEPVPAPHSQAKPVKKQTTPAKAEPKPVPQKPTAVPEQQWLV